MVLSVPVREVREAGFETVPLNLWTETGKTIRDEGARIYWLKCAAEDICGRRDSGMVEIEVINLLTESVETAMWIEYLELILEFKTNRIFWLTVSVKV